MRRLLLPLIALALLASIATAGTSPPGVNLSWDRCFGDGNVQFKQFACDTNTGSEQLVATFEMSSSFTGVTGIELDLDIGTSESALGGWWQFFTFGACRQTSLRVPALQLPAGSVNCVDWAESAAAGGLAAYRIDPRGWDWTELD